jgi:hypothetical protein
VKTLADDRDRALVLARLRGLRLDSPRRWGRMSVHQMVCHLADNFRMALGERGVESTFVPLPRGIVKWAALYAPIPWPKGIPTSPETDQERGGTRPGEFAADLGEAVRLFERVTADVDTLVRPHPVFGAMRVADWLRWGYLHTDHHLRQFGA